MHKTTAENLAVWHEAAQENRELRLLALIRAGEQAGDAWREGDTQDISAWRVALKQPKTDPLYPDGAAFAHGLAADEQLAFCRALLSRCPYFPREESIGEQPAPWPRAPMVATLNGDFFSRALRGFAAVIPDAQTLICDSFSQALECVAEEKADFALLPLETQHGSKLLAFYEECDRLELSVNCVADIPAPHGKQTLQFALLSRSDTLPPIEAGEPLLECRVFTEDGFTLADLLSAAAVCGFSLIRADAFPDPHGEGVFAHHVLFSAKDADRALLEAYMALRLPRAFVVELFLHIDRDKSKQGD